MTLFMVNHSYDHNGQGLTVVSQEPLVFHQESSYQIPNLVSCITGETLMEKKEGREERNMEIIGSVVEEEGNLETPPPKHHQKHFHSLNQVEVKKEGSSPVISLVLRWVQFLQRCGTVVVPVAEFLLCYLQPLAVIFIGMV